MIVQILFSFLYIFASTLLSGSAFRRNRGVADVILRGFCIQFALFSICYYLTLFVLHSRSMVVLEVMYLIVSSPLVVYGVFRHICFRKQVQSKFLKSIASMVSNKMISFPALAVIVYQAIRVGALEPFSISDNAEYYRVITAMVDKGEVYALGFSGKYIITPWYPYEAIIARITGCHGVIIASTVLPVFLVSLAYCALWRLGQTLYYDNDRKNYLFLLISAVVTELMLILADPAAYMLVWPTWGKNIPPSVICLVLFSLFLEMANKEHADGISIIWMFVFSIVAANTTAASMVAIPVQLFALSIIYLLREKRIDLCIASGVAILPEIVQFVLYCLYARGVLNL